MFVLILILITLLAVIFLVLSNNYENDNMIRIKSTIDKHNYWVRNLPDKQNGANTLAKIRENIVKLVNYLKQNMDKDGDIENDVLFLEKFTKQHNILVIGDMMANDILGAHNVGVSSLLIGEKVEIAKFKQDHNFDLVPTYRMSALEW